MSKSKKKAKREKKERRERAERLLRARVGLASSSKIERPVRFYWAYGSNLSFAQMRSRCPFARPFDKLSLTDGELTFRGYADVESAEGGRIEGGLWKITDLCQRTLDRFEGVGTGKNYEKRYLMLRINGRDEKCLYYRMVHQFGVMPPTDKYLKTIEQGYEDFGLDKRLLDEALARSWNEKAKTDLLQRRWEGWGRPKLARPKALEVTRPN